MGLNTRKTVFGIGKQQKRRPACVSAQTDQCLCYLLIRKCYNLTCYKSNFNFLASLCSWVHWFESCFVRIPEDRFCHVKVHNYDAQQGKRFNLIWISTHISCHAEYFYVLHPLNRPFLIFSSPELKAQGEVLWSVFFWHPSSGVHKLFLSTTTPPEPLVQI